MLVIRIPNRRSITKIKTSKGIQEIIEPYYGNRDKGGYFIGAAVGPGWNDIVLDLHNKLVKENPDYFIAQVKEKFGTLRFYTGPMTDKGWEYVREAEELSAVTCEECGRPGSLREDSHWLVTLCNWDHKVRNINIMLWRLQRSHHTVYWKIRFAINRWRMKKGYIK